MKTMAEISKMTEPVIHTLYDEATGSWQYVVHDPASRAAMIIDPVMDFDLVSARTNTENADKLLQYANDNDLDVQWIVETHPHADHMTAAQYLKRHTGAQVAIGARIAEVQATWKQIYGLGDEFATDGSQFDHLFEDDEVFQLGELEVRCMASPGHTAASMTYMVGKAAFVHDTLMMPDKGTSRADFPGGNADELYASLQALLALPDDTVLYVGHDYPGEARGPECAATVAEHKANNIHLQVDNAGEYRCIREERDAQLSLPKLLLAVMQVNLRAGHFPKADEQGRMFLKLPLNRFG